MTLVILKNMLRSRKKRITSGFIYVDFNSKKLKQWLLPGQGGDGGKGTRKDSD
jgi:hypothetical protein